MKRAVALLALLLVACGPGQMLGPTVTPDPCAPSLLRPAVEKLQAIAQHFDDINKLADNTPRSGLPAVISEMQSVRRDAQALEAPPCIASVKANLIGYMDAQLDVYTTFLNPDNSDYLVKQKAAAAHQQFLEYEAAVDSASAKLKK